MVKDARPHGLQVQQNICIRPIATRKLPTMANDNVDKVVEGGILGAAIGAGYEAIRTGKKGIADGVLSGVVLGAAWRGVTIVSDKSGLTKQINKAKDRILRR